MLPLIDTRAVLTPCNETQLRVDIDFLEPSPPFLNGKDGQMVR